MTTDVSETEVTPEAQASAPLAELENLETQTQSEAETPAVPAEPVVPEPVIEAPQPRSYADVQAAIDRGDLTTTAEQQAYRAENNRQRAQAFAANESRRRHQEIQAKREAAPDNLMQVFLDEVAEAEANNRGIVPKALKAELKTKFDGLMQDMEPMALAPYQDSLKADLWQMVSEAGGNPQGLLAYMESNIKADDFATQLKFYGDVRESLGQKRANETTDVGKLHAENARLKAEIETLTGSRGKGTVTTKGKEPAADSRSEDEQLLDPATPIDVVKKILATRR